MEDGLHKSRWQSKGFWANLIGSAVSGLAMFGVAVEAAPVQALLDEGWALGTAVMLFASNVMGLWGRLSATKQLD